MFVLIEVVGEVGEVGEVGNGWCHPKDCWSKLRNNVADYQLSVVIMVLLVDYLTLVLIVVVWMYESVW